MKKICFITMGNVYTVPYLNTYTKHIEGNYSIIYWDREGRDESDSKNEYYRFYKKVNSADKGEKLKGYFQYKKFVKKILLEKEFDLVIFLQTWAAILMSGFIKRHYSGKFIVDIRDYTYEHNPLIYHIEKGVFKYAYTCVISSEGYKDFLPPFDYHILHNNRELPREKVVSIQGRPKTKDKLNISFVGYVNYQEQHKKLLLNLKNDKRFHLNFIGTRALELELFCAENDISNVTLVDTFDSSKTLNFYEDTDFVNNIYGNNTPTLDYALSNKLYFAAELHIPILTCSNTFMSQIAGEYGFGFDVDVTDSKIGDKLWNYYQSIDWTRLGHDCDRFIEKVKEENRDSQEMLKKLLS